jgi:phage tail-like protein
MSAAAETTVAPFMSFNFEVLLTLAEPLSGVGDPVCQGAFAECDGLQLDHEPKSVTQGGANDSVTHLVGPTRPGQITLRRGMTTTADLWAWMAAVGVPGREVTADGRIVVLDAARQPQATFVVKGCLPVRLRGPALNAQTGLVAIEELGLAVGHLALDGATPAGGLGISAGIGISAGASFGASASVGAGVQVSGGLGLSGQLGGTLSASAGASAGFGIGGG